MWVPGTHPPSSWAPSQLCRTWSARCPLCSGCLFSGTQKPTEQRGGQAEKSGVGGLGATCALGCAALGAVSFTCQRIFKKCAIGQEQTTGCDIPCRHGAGSTKYRECWVRLFKAGKGTRRALPRSSWAPSAMDTYGWPFLRVERGHSPLSVYFAVFLMLITYKVLILKCSDLCSNTWSSTGCTSLGSCRYFEK